MDYIVASTVVMDRTTLANGKKLNTMAGGAGVYALSGMKLWTDSVEIATGVGADFGKLFGGWFEANDLSTAGLLVKDARTPCTDIQYFDDGEREEIPRYGLEHYRKIEITPEELAPYFKTAKGIYIFKNSDQNFWKKILRLKAEGNAKVMWEIGADAALPENLAVVRETARQLDVFSINMSEASALLGTGDSEEVTELLQGWNIPLVFLRKGKQGAVMISGDEIISVSSVEGTVVIDPTGGGNSSSGAVLYGWCEGKSLRCCGYMGSLSAAVCIGQVSVPERFTAEMRKQAHKKLNQYLEENEHVK